MPWEETCVMNQRVKFIADYLEGVYQMTELCDSYGISRKTGYKWVDRYEHLGIDGLKDLSRRPHSHPNTTDQWTREQIIQTKLAHQGFGPKKVIDFLRMQYPKHRWPADSTAGEILSRAGLVKARKRRRKVNADSQPFSHCHGPNDVWSVDFKGHFAVGSGQRCYPLTLTDNFSRYLLQVRALRKTGQAQVQPWLEWSFREYGLPDAIRSDNGPPFASLALGGISELSKWWIKLGIKPERIEPGKPQQNGRHERMHRSLGQCTGKASMSSQQRAFNQFVKEFNEQRSHEALQRRTPAQVYYSSGRIFPNRLAPIEYDQGFHVRQVRHNGEIKWQGQLLYISQVLTKEPVGLKQISDAQWEIYYSFYLLGAYDERTGNIQPCQLWHSKKH